MSIECKCGQKFGSLMQWRDHWIAGRPEVFEKNSRKGVTKEASELSKQKQREYDMQHVVIEPPKPKLIGIKTGRRNADNRTAGPERVTAARMTVDALLDMKPSQYKQAVQMLRLKKSIAEIAMTLKITEAEVDHMLRDVGKQAADAAPDMLGSAIERDFTPTDYPK